MEVEAPQSVLPEISSLTDHTYPTKKKIITCFKGKKRNFAHFGSFLQLYLICHKFEQMTEKIFASRSSVGQSFLQTSASAPLSLS